MKKVWLVLVICLICSSIGVSQENGLLLDSIVQYHYVSENDSVRYFKWDYRYNNDTKQCYYAWCFRHNGQWEIYQSQEKTFSQFGSLIEQIDYQSMEFGLGSPYVRQVWENDQNGFPIIMFKYHRSEEDQDWINKLKYVYKNNSKGQLVQRIHFSWSASRKDWNPNYLYTFGYNSFKFEVEQLIDTWNNDTNKWQLGRKNETSYTTDGVIVSNYTYSWNYILGTWKRRTDFWIEYDSLGRISRDMKTNIGSSQLREFQYDSIGNYTIFISSSPPWIGNYIPHLKDVKTVNDVGEEVVNERYNKVNGKWVPKIRSENIFSDLGLTKETRLFSWDEEILDWDMTGRKHYFYSQLATGNRLNVNEEVEIFPNPTSGLININGLKQPAVVRIFSIQGQLLKSKHKVESTIDISDLPTGVYILSLSSGETVLKKTIIKK